MSTPTPFSSNATDVKQTLEIGYRYYDPVNRIGPTEGDSKETPHDILEAQIDIEDFAYPAAAGVEIHTDFKKNRQWKEQQRHT